MGPFGSDRIEDKVRGSITILAHISWMIGTVGKSRDHAASSTGARCSRDQIPATAILDGWLMM
jgi:hypothetical protein